MILSHLVIAAVAALQQHPQHAQHPADGALRLFDDLGDYHHEISTDSELAQKYFDQGLRLTYAFNHAEAIRAYEEAARLDLECAICWWGVAYAYGPNINGAMDSASGVAAYDAVQKARALIAHASPVERAYIDAMATRYAAVPPADRAALDSAFARAMADVARTYPDDDDAATIAADAMMNLRPWDYWTKKGEPNDGTLELVGNLERVLVRTPAHPGACHLYIHAVEAAQPEKAVPCAERLAALMPGAGHIVHMPAHIYIRVGRWNDAIAANEHAVHADETYIADNQPEGVYPLGYYPHNFHFLAFAAGMAGRSAQALAAAEQASAKIPVDIARVVPAFEGVVAYYPLALVSFGKWEKALAHPLPPADVTTAHALVRYAHGVAHARLGHMDAARAELARIAEIAPTVEGYNAPVASIAQHALAAEIEAAQGNTDSAIAHFRIAKQLEDDLIYEEPPRWYYPIRHSLGALLLKQGNAAEAETLYREDLKRFPENGWALYGLAQALHAQNKHAEAAAVDARFKAAWSEADVKLSASRF